MYSSIVVGDSFVAIKWQDGKESYIKFKVLRQACPCAWCSGEKDVLGNTYIGKQKVLPSSAYGLSSYEKVGLYGVRFFWADGHKDGIYTFEHLRLL